VTRRFPDGMVDLRFAHGGEPYDGGTIFAIADDP
jgi:hypothetical protein